ncbi:MAG: hypothetical protein SVV80_09850 [Planctomycetota bacterium]|nr:hypothetical protein [Planctomycetota bacterium]
MMNRYSVFVAFCGIVLCTGCVTGHDANASRLTAAIDLSAGYLVRACGEDGRFTYRINTNPDVTPKPAYNMLRHAGAIYALAMYEQRRPDRKTRDAINRAVRFLKKNAVAPVPGKEVLLGVWSRPEIVKKSMHPQVKLGGVGLGLVALLSTEKVNPGTTPIDDLRKLGRCILFMQKTDGSFYSRYVPAWGGLRGEWVSLYYPGEAALGLMMLYEKDPSPQWLGGAAEAMAYLARSRAGKSVVEADHWALLATAKLLGVYEKSKQPIPRKDILQHARQICNRILNDQVKRPSDSPEHGCFRNDGSTCPTAIRLEGLLAAMTFLPDEDKLLRERINKAVDSGMSFLLRAQIRSGKYAGGIPRAIRTLPKDHPGFSESFNRRSTEIRIDYVQHALSAMIQFEKSRDKKKIAPQRRRILHNSKN